MNKFTESALWFIFQGDDILLQKHLTECSEHASLFPPNELDSLGISILHQQYLGIYQEKHCFAAEIDQQTLIPPGFSFHSLKQAYNLLNNPDLFLIASRAKQLLWWDKSSQFCGYCGTKTLLSEIERAKICSQCHAHFFPHVAPVVMVRITHGDKILLARSHHFTSGVYSVLAGFIEPGETAEEAVIREVREEVGLEIKNIAYFGSQPWPFPSNLMIGFTAEYASGSIKMDPKEIEDAQWFSLNELPSLPQKISLARRLIDDIRPTSP